MLLDLSIAPFYLRRLITQDPIEDAFVESVVQSVLLHTHAEPRKDA